MTGSSAGSIDRTRAPEAGVVRPFDFPDVVSTSLPCGLDLRTARLPRLPIVTASLVLEAGEVALPDERAGLAVLTGNALEGGTQRRSGAELAEALESIGAALAASTGWDASQVSVTCLADRLEEAIGLLAEVVREPAFPEDEVARFRSQRLAAIEQRRMDPGDLADDQALRLVYADGVQYGRPLAGTQESVGALNASDAAEYARRFYRPGGAGLVVVGDVLPDRAREMADRCFGDWEGRGPERMDLVAKARHEERRVYVVDRPGAVQSEIRLGHVGVPRSSADYFSLLVFNTILGGAFTSRLNLNLREKHGFTYGVRSRFAFRRGAGPFTVSTAVETDVTADAVRETLAEVERLVDEGPTDDEVEAAKDYIAGVFPLRLETTGQVASRIAELLVFGLPDDYHNTYRDRIREVAAADVTHSGRRHVRPDEMVCVIVGDADRVRGPLEALDLGPLEVLDAP